MKLSKKKANQIMGLYATLNKIELDLVIAKQEKTGGTFSGFSYQEFDCKIEFNETYNQFYCELLSQKLSLKEGKNFFGKKYYHGALAFGGHWPTTQTLYDDPCNYDDFELVIQFAKNAIASGGIANMKKSTHNVTVEMPDFLAYEKTSA